MSPVISVTYNNFTTILPTNNETVFIDTTKRTL